MCRTPAFPFGHVREIDDRRAYGARAARHLCRRARLGAARADRRDRRGLRRADGGGRAARHPARRLPRARIAAAGKGLSRLGLRHHAQRHALRGGARLGGEAEERPRPSSAARRCENSRATAARQERSPASPSTIRTIVLLGPRDDPARRRARRLSHQRRLWLHDRQAHRLWLCAQCRRASTTTISASGTLRAGGGQGERAGARSPASRSTIPTNATGEVHELPRRPPRPYPDHRRRRHRHVAGLSPGARWRERTCCSLEKAQLTHGCTWHAAGLVGQLRGKTQPDAADAEFRRRVRPAGAGDRPGDRLEEGRLAPACLVAASAGARSAAP